MKTRGVIITEALCYVCIAAGAPVVELLISDRELSQRALIASAAMAVVGAANALKAFLSQSMPPPPPRPPDHVFEPLDKAFADDPLP